MTKSILTEKDFDYLEERFREVFATKEEFKKYRSDVIDKLDEILKEIVANRQEQKVLARRSSDDDRLEALEKIHPRGQHAAA